MNDDTNRKVAVITGASSGIGRATAIQMAKDNIHVVLTSREKAALEETASQISNTDLYTIIPADLSDERMIQKVMDMTIQKYGRIDILVNAAGIIGSGTIETTQRDAWDQMMNINLRSPFLLTQLAVPHLEKTKGAIVNVSSVTGTRAFPGVLSYCVSKAGMDQMTRCIALELAPKGIRVNAVNPGVVRTNLHRRGGMDEEKYEAFVEHSKSTHPLGRIGEPEEVAELICFLASEKSGWITGTTISIDGGRAQTCAR